MLSKTDRIINTLVEKELVCITNTGVVLTATKEEMLKADIPEDIVEEILEMGI